MVSRQLSEDEGRRVLQRLQDAGFDTPPFWWEISTVKVDWAYALALSHHVGEPSSHDAGGNEESAASAGEVVENLDEELQRELVLRVMR